MFQKGELVVKPYGDYIMCGTIVGVCEKLSGEIRYNVEDERGTLHIYSDKQLILMPEDVKEQWMYIKTFYENLRKTIKTYV